MPKFRDSAVILRNSPAFEKWCCNFCRQFFCTVETPCLASFWDLFVFEKCCACLERVCEREELNGYSDEMNLTYIDRIYCIVRTDEWPDRRPIFNWLGQLDRTAFGQKGARLGYLGKCFLRKIKRVEVERRWRLTYRLTTKLQSITVSTIAIAQCAAR